MASTFMPVSTNTKGAAQLSTRAYADSSQQAALQLHPAPRGSWQCFCRGEVVMMRGHYGWLAVYGDIHHPDAAKHQGHIYVSKNDVVAGEDLVEGDRVSFYLYADGQGLGAEYCCQETTAEHDPEFVDNQSLMHCSLSQFGMRADALEFQPLCSLQAAVEAPWFEGAETSGCSAMNLDAAEFAASTHCDDSSCAQTGSEAEDEDEDESAWSEVASASDDENDALSAIDDDEVADWYDDTDTFSEDESETDGFALMMRMKALGANDETKRAVLCQ